MDKKTGKALEHMLAQAVPREVVVLRELEQRVAALEVLYTQRTLLLAQAVVHGSRGLNTWKIPLAVQQRLPLVYSLEIDERPEDGYTLLRIVEPSALWTPAKRGDGA